jgi:hypothetical protein
MKTRGQYKLTYVEMHYSFKIHSNIHFIEFRDDYMYLFCNLVKVSKEMDCNIIFRTHYQ